LATTTIARAAAGRSWLTATLANSARIQLRTPEAMLGRAFRNLSWIDLTALTQPDRDLVIEAIGCVAAAHGDVALPRSGIYSYRKPSFVRRFLAAFGRMPERWE
jgi:hypothetical protein